MKNIILTFIFASVSTFTHAENIKLSKDSLIADETTLSETASGKTLKVTTCNEEIAHILIKAFSPTHELKYSFSYKHDRKGYYPHWVFYFPTEKRQSILAAIPE